ncbi:GNAT family N-acetyltransferase [Aquimarina sp. 2201CG5-10]|uniref:GNAT family N-acetyltransferase n=1 Tax=Aquimarina callyspongiae TaxID=3098150 RepID=UPI002AB3EC2B|nr:GNAT family N-acetyltransferase [Aquimarina sp. 2201CG5-10]MDY8136217.1 GNAT family N-acetyltransferase [Aquimarina sp. 2201CG5-10]
MPSKELKIVPVQPQENQELLKFGWQTFYDTFGPPVNSEDNIQRYLNDKFTIEQIDKELNNPESQFYFAKLNDTIAGYLKLNYGNAQTEKVPGNTVEIERIYVAKEYQGNKIGQHLFNKTLEVAKNKQLEYIWLGVWDKNLEAIKFYQRQGFVAFDQHDFMLGTDLQTDILMKLAI